MNKIKLKSTGEVLEVKEPTYDTYWTFIETNKRAPDAMEMMGMCIGKSPQFVKDLPMTEGMQVHVACQDIIHGIQAMHILLFGTAKQQSNA